MAYSIGGYTIKEMELTRSWGLAPASASLVVMAPQALNADTEVNLNIGSAAFSGVITDSRLDEDEGRQVHVSVVDDRIKLMWDDVYGYFNGVEIIEDDPNTPGID